MAKLARAYGIEFDKEHPVHGGSHDKYIIGRHSVEVPRHKDIVEYTARGILRVFEELCEQSREEER